MRLQIGDLRIYNICKDCLRWVWRQQRGNHYP